MSIKAVAGSLSALFLLAGCVEQGRYLSQEDVLVGAKPNPSSMFMLSLPGGNHHGCKGNGTWGYDFKSKTVWAVNGGGAGNGDIALRVSEDRSDSIMLIRGYDSRNPYPYFVNNAGVPTPIADPQTRQRMIDVARELVSACDSAVDLAKKARLGIGTSLPTPQGTVSVSEAAEAPSDVANWAQYFDRSRQLRGYNR